jgi:protein dithiol:quinone oxidoreductase
LDNVEIVAGFWKPYSISGVQSRLFNWGGEMLSRLSVRQVMALISVACLSMLAFGIYLQHVEKLDPCPMCIVQRYALLLIAILAGLTAATRRKGDQIVGGSLLVLIAGFGAFTAARQSWLQWYPPEVVSCGRDLYGMIEAFPLKRVLPMIFKGSGDCSKVDWTFLGGSIANWSFVVFCAIGLLASALVVRRFVRAR